MGTELNAFRDFTAATAAVLDHLHRRLGFDCWVVGRDDGRGRVTLRATPAADGWVDAFARRLVQAEGSTVRPRVRHTSGMSDALMAVLLSSPRVRVGAYLAVPLRSRDGEPLGTLCAVHPAAVPNDVVLEHSLVELLARLLSTVLEREPT